MAFVSIYFLLFLLVTITVYYVLPIKIRKIWLLFVNVVFYYSFGVKNCVLLASVILISYGLGIIIQKKRSKYIFVVSLVLSITPLLLTKYLDFSFDCVGFVCKHIGLSFSTPTLSIMEPVGISFFTFKVISYLADVYKGSLKCRYSLLEYAVYISYFGTITSGPIDRPEAFMYSVHAGRSQSYKGFVKGFLMTVYGYFMKMVIADRIAFIVSTIYSNLDKYAGFPVVVTSILFSVQIYMDFCGYTYIVTGIARMMGLYYSENFMQPYFAETIKDFWRRWHISLSSWLRDYIYIPLGGNRMGALCKYRNLLITFVISGLWHGAGWNFLLWGLLHGVYQIVGEMTVNMRKKVKRLLHFERTVAERLLSIASTFLLVNMAWVIFYGSDNLLFVDIFKAMFAKSAVTLGWISDIGLSNSEITITVLSLIAVFLLDYMKERKVKLLDEFLSLWLPVRYLVLYALLFLIILFGYYGVGYDATSFIYFQF